MKCGWRREESYLATFSQQWSTTVGLFLSQSFSSSIFWFGSFLPEYGIPYTSQRGVRFSGDNINFYMTWPWVQLSVFQMWRASKGSVTSLQVSWWVSSWCKLLVMVKEPQQKRWVDTKYRVFFIKGPKVIAYCSKNKGLRDFQSLLGAHQMWSIC